MRKNLKFLIFGHKTKPLTVRKMSVKKETKKKQDKKMKKKKIERKGVKVRLKYQSVEQPLENLNCDFVIIFSKFK